MIRSLKERDWLPGFVAGLHRRQPRRVPPRRLRRQVPRRRDQGRSRRTSGSSRRRCSETPADRDARLRAAGCRRSLRLRDALLQLGRGLRVRDEGALEEARGDGPRPGRAGGLSAGGGDEVTPQRRRADRAGRRPAPASGSRRRRSSCSRTTATGPDHGQGRRARGPEQGSDQLPLRRQAGPRRRGGRAGQRR